jgi:acetyltransferase-like isoleucine patch superfamily enzyme
MENKISVITVVYNDVKNIRSTIESFFSQTWKDKEYIIIDGGSTDGTKNIIEEYSDRISYWCSEKDDGMYDAMNKGILKATGDWICILNSGDTFVTKSSLEYALTTIDVKEIDVIYGNSIEIDKDRDITIESSANYKDLEMEPIYRHGSSLIRTALQKEYMYDISKRESLEYALDWEMIYRVFKAGYIFKKVDVSIEAYLKDGVSNHLDRSLWYNYKITSQGKFSLKKIIFYLKRKVLTCFFKTNLYKWIRAFLMEYVINDILPHIPFWSWRKSILNLARMKIGYKSFIMKNNYIICPNHLKIGDCSCVNRGCVLDARGGIIIGNNVSISYNVKIMTGSHELNDPYFKGKYLPIIIGDYVWLGLGCCILNNVRIGRGAVVCAGAVVTKDVDDYTVVAGVPAIKIRDRNKNLDYNCIWNSPFT